jgi:hypothetical protein
MALQKCLALMNVIPQKYISPLWLLKGLLEESLGEITDATETFAKARKVDPVAGEFLDQNKSVCLDVFAAQTRLCSYYPHVEFVFPGHPALVLFLFLTCSK